MDLSTIKNFCSKRKGGLKRLAADIGMSEPNLHRCIRENKIQASDLEKISQLLGVDIRVFFDELPQSDSVTITNGSAAAVNVNAPINAPITAKSENSENHLLALLAEKDKVLEEKEKMIKEKERLIQILLKSQGKQ